MRETCLNEWFETTFRSLACKMNGFCPESNVTVLPVKAGWSTVQRKDVEGDSDRGQKVGLRSLGRERLQSLAVIL